jgi:hypothetical protein
MFFEPMFCFIKKKTYPNAEREMNRNYIRIKTVHVRDFT